MWVNKLLCLSTHLLLPSVYRQPSHTHRHPGSKRAPLCSVTTTSLSLTGTPSRRVSAQWCLGPADWHWLRVEGYNGCGGERDEGAGAGAGGEGRGCGALSHTHTHESILALLGPRQVKGPSQKQEELGWSISWIWSWQGGWACLSE